MPPGGHSSGIRLAELMTALSTATDLGMGQPIEHAMATCIVAVRLGELAGLADADLRDAYYEALLRYIGCNADTYWLSSLIGDELTFRTEVASVDTADDMAMIALMVRSIRRTHAGENLVRQALALARGAAQVPQFRSSFFPGHCEVARRLAERLGFPASFVTTIGQIYARWDGKGVPALRGDAIAPAMLVASLAQDAVVFYRLGGAEAAAAMARERSGGAHAPYLVELLCRHGDQLFAGLDDAPVWDLVIGHEPGEQRVLDDQEFDAACEAIADFADIKSPALLNHSRRVADLAAAAAERCGLPAADVTALRRAALLHDIGKVGVSAGIWGKPGPLTAHEWELVRLHPYYTERVLARPTALARLGELAALHHERLDGSGYYRRLAGPMLPVTARLLATANAYCALTEQRPYRAPCPPEEAARLLRREVQSGRLDGEALGAVLAAAGHQAGGRQRESVAGLSQRELEVLRLIARGYTTRQVADTLVISAKTADRHIQNIYAKIGVSTRAGATLFALEHRLLL
jgi:HD-GYP domain-containing protein (c-di-GMP phosphodiesterase class II)